MFVLKELFSPADSSKTNLVVTVDRCRIWNDDHGQISVLDRDTKVAFDDRGRLIQCDFAEGTSHARYGGHVVSMNWERGAWFFGKHGAWSPLN